MTRETEDSLRLINHIAEQVKTNTVHSPLEIPASELSTVNSGEYANWDKTVHILGRHINRVAQSLELVRIHLSQNQVEQIENTLEAAKDAFKQFQQRDRVAYQPDQPNPNYNQLIAELDQEVWAAVNSFKLQELDRQLTRLDSKFEEMAILRAQLDTLGQGLDQLLAPADSE